MSKVNGKEWTAWPVSDKIQGTRKRNRDCEMKEETDAWKEGGKPAKGKLKVEEEEPDPVNHPQCSLR